MKRLISLCMLLIVGLCSKAQTSICGVPFGQPYDVVKSILYDKFGEPDDLNHNEIWYDHKNYAGFYFEFLAFKFQANSGGTYFNECFMTRSFKDIKAAKEFRRGLFLELMKKYEDFSIYKDEFGFLAGKGGESPINEDEYGVFVYMRKVKSSYWVYLHYGPYNYANEEL